MAALVLACTAGSTASAMNEAALNASQSELMPVKKTTKKTSSKKTTTTTKKTTTSSAKTTTAAASASAATAPSTSSSLSSGSNSTVGSALAGVLGGLLGGSNSSSSTSSSSSSTAGSLISGLLDKVIGSGTFTQADLCATWKYSKPGCAFTSENLLAKAGGEIVANKIESDLAGYYSKFGLTSSNTYFTFNTDGTFNAKIDGKSWNGKYTFDEKTHAIQLKGLLLSMSGYATKTTNGISLLFESKKLLTLIKTICKLSGNSTLSTVGSIADNYDGVRIGFEMTK